MSDEEQWRSRIEQKLDKLFVIVAGEVGDQDNPGLARMNLELYEEVFGNHRKDIQGLKPRMDAVERRVDKAQYIAVGAGGVLGFVLKYASEWITGSHKP